MKLTSLVIYFLRMGYLFGCLAALFWGLKPPAITKIKADSLTTQLGTGIAVLIVSIIAFFITFNQSVNDLASEGGSSVILFSTLSGVSWALGQFFQFFCYLSLTTSIGFCISTAFTLVSNAVFSIVLFHDWSTPMQLGLGISAIFVIILGACMTVYKPKEKGENTKKNKKNLIIGVTCALIAGILFALYSTLPRYATSSSAPTSVLLPHGIGTFLGSIFVVILYRIYVKYHNEKNENKIKLDRVFNSKLAPSLIPGLLSSISNILLIYANADVGSAIGFSLTQMSVVVSSLVSLFFLKEYKINTKMQNILIIIGSLIILAGGIMIGFTKM